jgi:hypothetical protein
MKTKEWLHNLLIKYQDDPVFQTEGIIFALNERVAVLEKQRDELLAACKAWIEYQEEYYKNTLCDFPGNNYYAEKAMVIVRQTNIAIHFKTWRANESLLNQRFKPARPGA